VERNRNKRLIAKRKERDLTQERIANDVGIHVRYYQSLEAGVFKPNVEIALLIAELLECDVRDIFSASRIRIQETKEAVISDGQTQKDQ
jgi:DNA-binding XRE family transcriptional regulator